MTVLATLGLTTIMPLTAGAVEYDGALNATTSVDAEITLPDEVVVPPIDPGDPNPPVDPVNPEHGDGLSLLYVSNLDFGSANFNLTTSQTLEAALDSGLDTVGEVVTFENMVSVMDIRGERQDGWALRVSQTADLFEGAEITMKPRVSANNLGVSVPVSSLVVNSSSQDFATADGTGEAGTISLGMGTVELNVPAGTGIGEYSTTLNWTLVSEPTP